MRASCTTRLAAMFVMMVLPFQALAAELSTKQRSRVREAATVLDEIHTVPDKDIPQDLWNKAACVLVIPSLKKAAFVFGGEYGRGLMSCRLGDRWSAPVFMQLEKGSWGFQIGAQAIDLVLLVMNRAGMDKLLRNKVSLGAEASVAGGPLGRDARAATDAQMSAEILSYSRTQGLFAGINLSGGVVKMDRGDNQDLYGPDIDPRDALTNPEVKVPSAAQTFMSALERRK